MDERHCDSCENYKYNENGYKMCSKWDCEYKATRNPIINAVKKYEKAVSLAEHDKITLGEYEEMIKPLENVIVIPEDATNGDILQALFPDCIIKGGRELGWIETSIDTNSVFDYNWWNSPYKRG